MKVLVRKAYLVLLLLGLGLCLVVFAYQQVAKAEVSIDSVIATMDFGASVRASNDAEGTGIRFTMTMTKDHYEALTEGNLGVSNVKFGVFILPESYKQTADFTEENFFGEDAKYYWGEINENEVAKKYVWNVESQDMGKVIIDAQNYVYKLSGAMVNIRPNNIDREFVGVGYFSYNKDGQDKFKLASFDNANIENNTRSMVEVAYEAVQDDETISSVKEILYSEYIEKTSYNVTWKVEGETVKTETLHYGDMPVAPENPEKAEDGVFTYQFNGWDKEVSIAKGNVEYVAMFKPILKTFNTAVKQTVYVGETAPLSHNDYYGVDYILESSDSNIVRIEGKKIVGVSAGEAQVTISAVGFDLRETCTVVAENDTGYDVTEYYNIANHVAFNGATENYDIINDSNYNVFGGSAIKYNPAGNRITLSGIPVGSDVSQADDKKLTFWIYSNKDLTNVYIAGGSGLTGTIPAKQWTKVSYNLAWLDAWGVISQDSLGIYYINNLMIDEYDAAEMYITGISISSGAVDSLALNVNYNAQENITGSPYLVPAADCGAIINVYNETTGENVELSEQNTFDPIGGNSYKISYSLTIYDKSLVKDISVSFIDDRIAKFITKPANAVITPDGTTTIANYANANKPTGTDGATITCTGEIHYFNNTSLSEAYGGGKAGAFDALTSTIKLQNDWIFVLNWKIENEYGFETYTQTIYCRTTENKVIPITPENVEISGSAELVNLSGDAENPVYSIRVTGTATITFSNTFIGVNDSANRLTFMAMVNNHSSVDGKIHVYNKSQTLVVGAASNYNMNDCPVMLKIGEAYGNENFFDANEKLQIVVESSNPNAEMYIDFLTVGNAVTIS